MTDTLRDRLQEALGRDYRIDRELGGGGMSRVFAAVEVELDRPVVLKVLLPESVHEPDMEQILREIQVSAGLDHPRIVPVHAAGRAGDVVYVTMPLVDGESLRARLEREGRLPMAAAVAILRDIAEALVYAHKRGVVHGDIRPETVLLAGNHALVTDFGAAAAVRPERLDDVRAVGYLACELLTGQRPAVTPSDEALASAGTLCDDMPPAVHEVVMRCHSGAGRPRFRSAQQLAHALDRLAFAGGNSDTSIRRSGMLRKLAAAVILIGLTQPYACDVRPVVGVWDDLPSVLLFGVPLLAAVLYALLTLAPSLARAVQSTGPAWHGVLRAVFFLLAGGYLLHAVRQDASSEDRLGVAAALLVAGVMLVWHQGRGTKADRLPLLLLAIVAIPVVDLLVWSRFGLQVGGWLVSAGWALAVLEEVRLLRLTPSIVHGG